MRFYKNAALFSLLSTTKQQTFANQQRGGDLAKIIAHDYNASGPILSGLETIARVTALVTSNEGKKGAIGTRDGFTMTRDIKALVESIIASHPFENFAVLQMKHLLSEMQGDSPILYAFTAALTAALFKEMVVKKASLPISSFIISLCNASVWCKKPTPFQLALQFSAYDEAVARFVSDLINLPSFPSLDEAELVIHHAEKTDIFTKPGFHLSEGIASPYFITHPQKMASVLEDVKILIVEGNLVEPNALDTLLKQLGKQERLMLIARAISDDVLETLVMYHLTEQLQVCCITCPSSISLHDLALFTKALVIEKGTPITKKVLGRAQTASIDSNQAVIEQGDGDIKAIAKKVDGLRKKIPLCRRFQERVDLQKRLAQLRGQGIIECFLPKAMYERRLCIAQTLYSTRQALKEKTLDKRCLSKIAMENEEMGFMIKNIFFQLHQNVVLTKASLIEALRRGASIAKLLLSPQCLIR